MFFATRKLRRSRGRWGVRPARRRARDGHEFLSASSRRRVRKILGLSARRQRRLTKERRAYKKGRPSNSGRLF